jgi:hypothetical protein
MEDNEEEVKEIECLSVKVRLANALSSNEYIIVVIFSKIIQFIG